MFRMIGGLIKLITMASTLLVAIEQIRKVLRDRRNDKEASGNQA
jgi:hypothetical protein